MRPENWITIQEAAKIAGVTPPAVRHWIDYKGLESMPYEPDFGHKTTLVHIDDVKEIMQKRGNK